MIHPRAIANDLINNKLGVAHYAMYPAVGAGLAGTVADMSQGDPVTLTDNALFSTLGNAVGYGALASGVGAASMAPALLRERAIAQKLEENNRMTQRNAVRLDKRQSRLGSKAARRARVGGGLTAAGASLLSLIGSFRDRTPNEAPAEEGNRGNAALGALAAASLLATPMYDDDSSPLKNSQHLYADDLLLAPGSGSAFDPGRRRL